MNFIPSKPHRITIELSNHGSLTSREIVLFNVEEELNSSKALPFKLPKDIVAFCSWNNSVCRYEDICRYISETADIEVDRIYSDLECYAMVKTNRQAQNICYPLHLVPLGQEYRRKLLCSTGLHLEFPTGSFNVFLNPMSSLTIPALKPRETITLTFDCFDQKTKLYDHERVRPTIVSLSVTNTNSQAESFVLFGYEHYATYANYGNPAGIIIKSLNGLNENLYTEYMRETSRRPVHFSQIYCSTPNKMAVRSKTYSGGTNTFVFVKDCYPYGLMPATHTKEILTHVSSDMVAAFENLNKKGVGIGRVNTIMSEAYKINPPVVIDGFTEIIPDGWKLKGHQEVIIDLELS